MLEIVSTSIILGPSEIGGPRLKPFQPNGTFRACLLVSVSRWISWLEPFRFHVNCVHFLNLLSFM